MKHKPNKNTESTATGKSDKTESGNRKLFVVDVLVIAGIIVSVGMASYSFFYKPEIPYNYSETTTVNNTVVSYTSFNFTSKEVFSAQNPISVTGITKFDDNYIKNHPETLKNITKFYIYFPTSQPKNLTYKSGWIILDPMIMMKGDDDIFRGNTELIYQAEGDKYPISSLDKLYRMPIVPANTDPAIHISSVDSLYQKQTNDVTISLTWLMLGFSIAIIRDFIKDFIYNTLALKSNKKDKAIKDTPEYNDTLAK